MASKQAQEATDAQLIALEARDLRSSSQQQIQELKMRRNTYALISKLPDDVLLEIFAFTQTIFPEDEWFREVTHVCHRWRYIAIEAGTLWTNPPLFRHDLSILMLERSKSTSLTICLRFNLAHKTIMHAINYAGRIETLEISLETRFLDRMLEIIRNNGQQASRLRKVVLHCLSDTYWDCRPLFSLSTVFNDLNLLRELCITNIVFTWSIFPLPDLVSLKSIQVSFQPRVSMQQFLHALRQMPRLENLQISIPESQFSLSSSTTATNPVLLVTLPRLAHLDLSDSDLGCVQWLLHRLTLPRLRRTLMSGLRQTPSSDNDASHIAHVIASSVTNGDFGAFESLNLYSSNFRLSMLGQHRDDAPHLHFSTRNQGSGANNAFTQASLEMFSLCRSSLLGLVELKIENFPLTVDEMSRLSTSLCSLRKIEIFRGASVVSALINVLATPPPHCSDPADADIPFPALRSIVFSVVNIASHPIIFNDLCDCLMLRHEYGVAVHELILFECWVFAWQLSLLEEIIVDVDSTIVLQ